jgi:hypothetical protein
MRYEFDVVSIEGSGRDARVHYTLVKSGRPGNVLLSVLQKGLRASRLVRHSDGHEAYRPPADKLSLTAEETKTASDYRRVTKPKGVAKAAPHMEEAFRMRTELKIPVGEVAAHFDVSTNRIASWCKVVRDAREDEQNLGRTG